MEEYQKGIYDLQTLLRKYGGCVIGNVGMKKAYLKFLSENGIQRRRPTKAQRGVHECLYGFPPSCKSTTNTETAVYDIKFPANLRVGKC